MLGPKRLFYACLGISKCGATPLSDIQSAEYSLNSTVNSTFKVGDKNPITYVTSNPDIEVRYTQYALIGEGFPDVNTEDGLNNFIGFNILANSQDPALWPDLNLQNLSLTAKITGSYMLLNSITYNLNIDGPFTIDRTYKGFSKPSQSQNSSSVPFKVPTGTGPNYVLTRSQFTGSLPSAIANNYPQSITITRSFNRQIVNEFASRKPYASYISFPIETTCTFEVLSSNFDTYEIRAMQKACQNPVSNSEDITISVCDGNSISIPKAYLTALQYTGGSTSSSTDNQTILITYTSYETPTSIEPVIILPDEDPCD